MSNQRIWSALGTTLSGAGVTINAIALGTTHYILGLQIAGLACQAVGGFIAQVTRPIQDVFKKDA